MKQYSHGLKGNAAVQAGVIYCREELAARTPVENPGAGQERGRSPCLCLEGEQGVLTAYKLPVTFGQRFWVLGGGWDPPTPLPPLLCHCHSLGHVTSSIPVPAPRGSKGLILQPIKPGMVLMCPYLSRDVPPQARALGAGEDEHFISSTLALINL